MDTVRIDCVTGGPLDVNTYVVGQEGSGVCFLIDPGADPESIRAAIGLRAVTAILLTHAHFDHILHAKEWMGKDLAVYIHKLDVPMLSDPFLNHSYIIGEALSITEPIREIAEGDAIHQAGITLEVLHTPGHTAGSVCYRMNDVLFSGDTIFYHSFGRTDLPGGSMEDMRASIGRILQLPDRIRIYPGHGADSTVGQERVFYL